MLAAGWRGGGGQRKRKTETEIITNRRDCARSARDGGGVGAGREPFPGGARRWEVARTKRNTTPVWASDAPKTPLPDPRPPTHERDTAPLPTQITRGDTVSPSPRADTPPGNPMGETQSPLPEKSRVETPPKRLSLGQHKPTKHQETAPHREEMAPEAGPSGERGIPEPLREKTAQSCPVLSEVLQVRDTPGEEVQGGPETSLPRHASEIAPFPGKRHGPRLTCLKYSEKPWEDNRLPREPG